LDQAVSEADRMRDGIAIMTRQLADLQDRIPGLAGSITAAEAQYRRRNLDGATLAGLRSDYDGDVAAAVRLEAALKKADAALRMLLGLPLTDD
ncbi:MAG: hypothetical protein ACREFX_08695, partial [Opitutaceae bacterium]